MRTPKLGLALGSGAFRGLAHIGVLDVFLQEGLPVDMIAGTSFGAVVGGVYAAGMEPGEMERRACELSEIQYYDITVPRRGFLAGNRVSALLKELTQGRAFAQTRLPFAAVACDFETMEKVVLQEGPIYEAVRASISIPGVFVPVTRGERVRVDGGLVDRVPADVCRRMGADVVVGVDVGYRGQRVAAGNILENVLHAYDILEWQVARAHVSLSDVLIAPNVLDIDPARIAGRAVEIIERGRTAARAALADVRAALDRWTEREDGT